MANGTPAFPSQATMQQQQQQQMRSMNSIMNSTMNNNSDSVARVKQQQQAMTIATTAHNATQLQQRAAQAAQFLTAERKISSREIQAMLEKNDAALRGWNVLHTQEPPKTLAKEHKDWIRKCMTYRQQVGARLEVLASLADKQIAIEDESSDRVKKAKTQPQQERAPAAPSPSVVHPPQTASKKSKASAALARQAAQNKQKAVPVAAQRAAPAAIDNGMQLPTSGAVSATPIPSPTSFPEPPMPMANPQQFDYSATTNGVFYGSNQSSAMTSTSGFGNTSMVIASTPDMVSVAAQAFPMSGAQAFANSSYMNPGDSAAMAFMNQQNYLMNPMAMMNPQQYMAMQMQMQGQMPMNIAAGGSSMYNSSAMFNGYGGMSSNQLPADPFNTPFNQQQAFPGQPQFNPVAGGFDTMGGMQSAAMMNPMSTFPLMPEQMMMNAFPFGMSMPQQQQQQQLQNTSMQFQNPGTSAAQAFAMPQQQQPQQQLPQQSQQLQQLQQQPLQQQQPDSQTNAFPESSLFDDAINSNLFDGFEEDAFLLEM